MDIPPSTSAAASPRSALRGVNPTDGQPLDVWFLHVGHGDCAIIRHTDGRFTVIDLNLRRSIEDHAVDVGLDCAGFKEPWDVLGSFIRGAKTPCAAAACTDPISFLRSMNAHEVHRLILTHPDMDHLRGLARLRVAFPIATLWDTHNLKWIAPSAFQHEADAVDWTGYQLLRSGKLNTAVLRPAAPGNGRYWKQDGLTVLAPGLEDIVEANLTGAWNRISYVVRLEHGAASVMFAGDAEPRTLERLALAVGDGLRSTILKAPHHGRVSCWCSRFVKCVAPRVTVISAGEMNSNHQAVREYARVSPVLLTLEHGIVGFRLHLNGKIQRLRWRSLAERANMLGRIVGGLDRL